MWHTKAIIRHSRKEGLSSFQSPRCAAWATGADLSRQVKSALPLMAVTGFNRTPTISQKTTSSFFLKIEKKQRSCSLITEKWNQILDLLLKGLSHRSLFWTLRSVANIAPAVLLRSSEHFCRIPSQCLCVYESPEQSAQGPETGKDEAS